MAAPAPGAEFLERRLARATAVPRAQRSPEVAAFVEAMQLLREVAELLPLTEDGRPVLPHTPATRRQVGWPTTTVSNRRSRRCLPPELCRGMQTTAASPALFGTPALHAQHHHFLPLAGAAGVAQERAPLLCLPK